MKRGKHIAMAMRRLSFGTRFFLVFAMVLGTITANANFNRANALTVTQGACTATVDSTGGVSVYESGQFCYVAFKTTGVTYTYTPPTGVTNFNILTVAGGGSGGARHSGGGGAGGLLQLKGQAVSGNLTISIGAGGAAIPAQSAGVGLHGNNGTNSSVSGGGITTQTAIGGGYGGYNESGSSGGSGGGSSCCSSTTGGTGTSGQGFAGGYGSNGSPYNAGGGGGAGEAGKNLTLVNAQSAGAGGAGLAISWLPTTASTSLGVGQVSGSSTYFAGGGGGGSASGTGGAGGLGGGTAGGSAASAVVDATANTGGGGGGSGLSAGNAAPASGAGGSGVVVLSYAKPQGIDYSLNLDGTVNQSGTLASTPVIPNSGDFTVEAWIKPASGLADYAMVLSQGPATAGGSFYLNRINVAGVNKDQMAYRRPGLSGGVAASWQTCKIPVPVDQWTHVAVSFAGTTSSCYINGALGSTFTATSWTNLASGNFQVSGWVEDPTNLSYRWKGSLDEIRVYNTSRTASDIVNDLGKYGPTNATGLTTYYDFNEGSGTVASNQAAGADTATNLNVGGTPTWSDLATSATSGNNTVVTFPRSYLNNSGGWATPANVTTVQALIIGGGGGGGDSSTTSTGGSGGAGGYFASSAVPLSGRISIGVGTGGSGALTTSTNGTSGGDSWLGSLKVGGGGYGNSYGFTSAQAAGAGGGGSTYVTGGNGGGGRAKQSTVNASMNGGAGGAIAASGVTFGGTTFTGLAGVAGATSGADVNSGAWGGSITEANRTSSISGSSVVYAKSGTYYPWGHASNTLNPQTYGSGGATNYVYGATEVAPNTLGGNGAQGIVVVSYQSTFTVTYNSLGGSAVTAGSFSLGGNVASAPTNPIRTGYTFGGWVTASDGSGTAITFPYTPASNADLTLYAKWTPVAQSVDYALTLPGVSSGAVNTATILPSTSAFTLETWIKPDAVTTSNANAVIVSQGTSDISRFYLKRVTNALASNGHIIYLRDGATGEGDCGYAPPDVWTHIAVTYSGSGSTTCYLNGSFQSSITGSASLTSRFVVGDYSRLSGTNNMWKGAIDELRVYNVARSAPEIAADLQTYGPTNTSSLLAYYDFNEGTGAVASNQKSAADTTYDLTFTGSPTWTDVASTTTSGASTVVTFNRSYLNNSGGWAAPASGKALNYLVIGGGGGGGSAIATAHGAGGGGAGGYRTNLPGASSGANSSAEATFTSSGGFYGVKVGVGGSRQKTWSGVSTPATPAGKGGDSTFATITALGGGGGADYYGNTATSGGSGGGGSISNSSARYSGASGTANQGFAGASAQTGIYDMHGGGGGGAGSIGVAGSSSGPGAGGAGVSSTITGSSVVRASGGAGGSGTTSTAATSGAANTGNGGGGGNAVSNVVGSAGDGGSGVVIVSYRSAFAITYAAGSGSGSSPTSPLTVGLANSFITPANTFDRSGYTFAGWSDGTSVFQAGDRYPASGNVTQDVTLTATWIPSTATINFDSNGGSSLSTSSAAYGSGISKPADPTKANKYFGGWSTSEASNQGDVANRVSWPYTPGSADTTLYAIWNDDQSINFAGTSATSARKVGATGSEVRIVPHDSSFTWEAWIYPTGFAGTGTTKWATIIDNADDGLNYGRAFMYAMTSTSTANFMSTGYWVDANNGLAVDAPANSLTLNTWQHVAMTVERTGAAEGSCTGAGSVTIKLFVNGIQVATGTDSSFVGCLNSKGLVIGDNIDDPNQQFKGKIDQVKIWNGVLTASEVGSSRAAYSTTGVDNILRAHYSFNESNKTPTLNDVIDNVASALPDYDLQFYGADGTAVLNNISWTQNLFQVAFNGNSSTSGSVSSSTNLAPFTTISSPGAGTLVKTGYSFNGWNAVANLSGANFAENDNYPVLYGDSTLYAKWSAQSQNITYANGGGTGSAPTTPTTVLSGASFTVPANTFNRTGYTFAGWSDGSATYQAGDTYGASGAINATVALTATWTPDTYAITYDSNGGSAVSNGSYTVGGGPLTLPPATKVGMLLQGWFKNALRTILAARSGGSYTPNASETLYAGWTNTLVNLDASSITSLPTAAGTWTSILPASTDLVGTKTGNVTKATTNGISYASFDGAGDSYMFDANTGNTPGAMTALAWINPTSLNTGGSTPWNIIASRWFTDTSGNGTTASQDWHYSLKWDSTSSTIKQNLYTSTASDKFGTKTFPATSADKWYLVGFTINSSNQLQFFVNGKTDGTLISSVSHVDNSTARLILGDSRTATVGMPGKISTFRLYNTALSTSAIDEIYQAEAASFTHVTVTFNANDGSGTPATATQVVPNGVVGSLNANTFSRSNYTFNGWNTAADGSGTPYADASSINVAAATTLYAQWQSTTRTVTYNSNGGSAVTDGSFVDGGAIASAPTDPSKTGYDFAGWSATDGGTAISFPYSPGVTTNITLYAKWTPRGNDVTFNSNFGTSTTATQSITSGTATALRTNSFSRNGYTFAGWNTLADGTGTAYTAGQSVTIYAALTLYAQWTEIHFTVTYNVNSGSGTPERSTDVYGISTGALTLPAVGSMTRTGYKFEGWSTTNNGTAISGTYTPTADITLYAVWSAKSYAITYFDTSKTSGSAPSAGSYVTGGSALSVAAAGSLARSGYNFAGWNTAIDGTGTSYAAGDSLTTSAPVNLYPKWTAVNYQITYDTQNSTGGSAPTDATNYNIGNNAVVKANTGALVRTGYTFAGWTVAANNSGTVLQSGDTYTFGAAGVTLYPKWTANTYTITYNSNGATTDTRSVTSETYTSGNSGISLPNNSNADMLRTGYNFSGWATTATGTVLSGASATSYTTAADVTLYAIWAKKSITYQYNRGMINAVAMTGSEVASFPGTGSTTAYYNSSVTFSSTISSTISYAGNSYKFFGWTDGNTTYQPGNTFAIDASVIDNASPIAFAAQWIRLFNVRYALNGGTGVVDIDNECDATTHVCTDGQVITLNTAPTRDGYTFGGWKDQSNADFAAGASATITANSYLYYAQWTANNYNISFDSIGGSIAPATQVKNIGNAVTLPSPGTRTGYDFTGWTLGGVTYGEGTTFTVGTSHAAFTALWTPKRYNVSYDWNGGVGSPNAPSIYTYGQAAITLPTGAGHTKDGYVFDGWALTPGGAKLGTTDIPTSDVQYVARWIDGAYAITYDAVNGSTATTVNVTRATSTTLPTPTRTGYSFDGWYSDVAYTSLFGAAGASVSPTSTKTVYGKWTQNSLVGINPAHLNMRGSVIADASTNGTISATHSASGTGATVTVPAGALPTGTVVQLSFVEDLTRPKNLINNSFAYFTSAVLHWQSGSGATATVPSAAAGKPLVLTMTNPDIRSGAQIYKIVKGVATLVATATQDGSVSISIYDDPEIVIAATTPLAPMSVTAVGNLNAKSTVSWTAPTSSGGTAISSYTVTASPGGASCTSTTTSCVVQGLNNDTNYTFTVKATNAVGDSVASSASNSVIPRAVPTFNAVFNSKGGSTVADSLFTQPGTLSEPSAPTRTGYTFAGWLSQDGVTSSLVTFPYSPGVNSDVTLYAHWTANAPTGGSPSTSGPINTVTPVTSVPTTDTTTKTPLINVPEAPSLYTAPQSQFTELRNAPYPTNGLNVPASGEVIALVNREPVIVKVTPKENETLIEFGKDLSVTLKSTALDGKPVAVTNGVLTVLKGAYIAANGDGFKAGSPVEAWMYSNPIRLGDGIANADGSFENTFNLPTDAPLGKHTVVLNGLAPDSKIVTLALGVQVIEKVAAPQTNDELQNKSPESIIQNALAIASWFAIAIVLWLFILRRRRERKH